MANRRHGWRFRFALVAIHLLAVQALLSGLTLAAHAVPAPGGPFAAAICTPAGITEAPATPIERHDTSCCLIGCTGAGSSAAPPPTTVSADVIRIAREGLMSPQVDRPGGGSVRELPRTRAPPRAV